MSENETPPAGIASACLAAGRRMAEQSLDDSGASYRLLRFAYPAVAQQAMQAVFAEEEYLSKCVALGISADDARQILDDTIADADQRGLPVTTVWPQAWELAIEKSMQ